MPNEVDKGKVAVKIVAILALAAIVMVSLVRDRIVNPPYNQITVSGQGKVSYVPDRAMVTIGVQIDKAATADSALRDLSAKMTRIVDALKKSGIAAENISTQNYSLYPQYDYVDGISRPSGYSANQQLSVKVKDLANDSESVSKVIGLATTAGANQILGVTYDINDIETLKQQARLKANSDARAKAAEIAKSLGVRIGKITSWYENPVMAPGVPYYYADKGGMGGGAASGPVPLGSQEIIIEVGITYKIK